MWRRSWLFSLVTVPLLLLATQGLTLARTEYVKNGSFEVDSDRDDLPDDWRGHNLGPNDRIVPDPYVGEYSFQMVGEQGVSKALRQAISVNLPGGTDTLFQAFAKTDHESREGGIFACKVILSYKNGTGETILLKFRPRSEWQSRGFERILRGRLQRIDVSVIYNDQIGTAWFDNVQVLSDP